MKRKKTALASLSKLASNKSFVLASSEVEYNSGIKLSSFSCSECNAGFIAEANTLPFCVHCGSDEVEEIDGEEVEMPDDDSELSAVVCSSCGTHNIMSDSMAIALAGQMGCIACGENIEYPVSAVTASEDETEIDDEEIDGDDELAKILANKTVVSETDEDDFTEDDEETAYEDLDEELEDEETAETEIEDDDLEDIIEEESKKKCASLLLVKSAKGDFTLARVNSDVIVAFVGNTPVGTLKKEIANSEVASVMQTDSFLAAIRHSQKQIGTEKALAHYGFEMHSVSIPIPKMVEERASEIVAEKEKEFATALKTIKDDLKHGLQIAAAGLNKSFFKEKENVIKAALYQEMQASGMKNPERIIDKVFAHYSDKYHTTLLEVAEDLLSKGTEVRNEIAKAIGQANYQNAATEDEDEDEDVIDESLETSGLAASRNVHQVQATLSEVRERNGGRLFSINR